MSDIPRQPRDFPIGPFAKAAERWFDDTQPRPEPTVPAQAATVLLVRGEPVEVFMIERAATMDFAPSTWVFPGGRVDPADLGVDDAPAHRLRSPAGGEQAWADRLGVGHDEALSVLVCALRELFEEAGVLLASEGDGDAIVDVATDEWRARRTQVEAHEVSFTEAAAGLTLRGDLVEAVDRWITPAFESRRFDTWFLTALLPDGATADAVSRESQRGQWVRPEAMLAEAEAGRARLLPPTRTALERLSRASSATEALVQARGFHFLPTRPELLKGPDGPYVHAEVNL